MISTTSGHTHFWQRPAFATAHGTARGSRPCGRICAEMKLGTTISLMVKRCNPHLSTSEPCRCQSGPSSLSQHVTDPTRATPPRYAHMQVNCAEASFHVVAAAATCVFHNMSNIPDIICLGYRLVRRRLVLELPWPFLGPDPHLSAPFSQEDAKTANFHPPRLPTTK